MEMEVDENPNSGELAKAIVRHVVLSSHPGTVRLDPNGDFIGPQKSFEAQLLFLRNFIPGLGAFVVSQVKKTKSSKAKIKDDVLIALANQYKKVVGAARCWRKLKTDIAESLKPGELKVQPLVEVTGIPRSQQRLEVVKLAKGRKDSDPSNSTFVKNPLAEAINGEPAIAKMITSDNLGELFKLLNDNTPTLKALLTSDIAPAAQGRQAAFVLHKKKVSVKTTPTKHIMVVFDKLSVTHNFPNPNDEECNLVTSLNLEASGESRLFGLILSVIAPCWSSRCNYLQKIVAVAFHHFNEFTNDESKWKRLHLCVMIVHFFALSKNLDDWHLHPDVQLHKDPNMAHWQLFSTLLEQLKQCTSLVKLQQDHVHWISMVQSLNYAAIGLVNKDVDLKHLLANPHSLPICSAPQSESINEMLDFFYENWPVQLEKVQSIVGSHSTKPLQPIIGNQCEQEEDDEEDDDEDEEEEEYKTAHKTADDAPDHMDMDDSDDSDDSSLSEHEEENHISPSEPTSLIAQIQRLMANLQNPPTTEQLESLAALFEQLNGCKSNPSDADAVNILNQMKEKLPKKKGDDADDADDDDDDEAMWWWSFIHTMGTYLKLTTLNFKDGDSYSLDNIANWLGDTYCLAGDNSKSLIERQAADLTTNGRRATRATTGSSGSKPLDLPDLYRMVCQLQGFDQTQRDNKRVVLSVSHICEESEDHVPSLKLDDSHPPSAELSELPCIKGSPRVDAALTLTANKCTGDVHMEIGTDYLFLILSLVYVNADLLLQLCGSMEQTFRDLCDKVTESVKALMGQDTLVLYKDDTVASESFMNCMTFFDRKKQNTGDIGYKQFVLLMHYLCNCWNQSIVPLIQYNDDNQVVGWSFPVSMDVIIPSAMQPKIPRESNVFLQSFEVSGTTKVAGRTYHIVRTPDGLVTVLEKYAVYPSLGDTKKLAFKVPTGCPIPNTMELDLQEKTILWSVHDKNSSGASHLDEDHVTKMKEIEATMFKGSTENKISSALVLIRTVDNELVLPYSSVQFQQMQTMRCDMSRLHTMPNEIAIVQIAQLLRNAHQDLAIQGTNPDVLYPAYYRIIASLVNDGFKEARCKELLEELKQEAYGFSFERVFSSRSICCECVAGVLKEVVLTLFKAISKLSKIVTVSALENLCPLAGFNVVMEKLKQLVHCYDFLESWAAQVVVIDMTKEEVSTQQHKAIFEMLAIHEGSSPESSPRIDVVVPPEVGIVHSGANQRHVIVFGEDDDKSSLHALTLPSINWQNVPPPIEEQVAAFVATSTLCGFVINGFYQLLMAMIFIFRVVEVREDGLHWTPFARTFFGQKRMTFDPSDFTFGHMLTSLGLQLQENTLFISAEIFDLKDKAMENHFVIKWLEHFGYEFDHNLVLIHDQLDAPFQSWDVSQIYDTLHQIILEDDIPKEVGLLGRYAQCLTLACNYPCNDRIAEVLLEHVEGLFLLDLQDGNIAHASVTTDRSRDFQIKVVLDGDTFSVYIAQTKSDCEWSSPMQQIEMVTFLHKLLQKKPAANDQDLDTVASTMCLSGFVRTTFEDTILVNGLNKDELRIMMLDLGFFPEVRHALDACKSGDKTALAGYVIPHVLQEDTNYLDIFRHCAFNPARLIIALLYARVPGAHKRRVTLKEYLSIGHPYNEEEQRNGTQVPYSFNVGPAMEPAKVVLCLRIADIPANHLPEDQSDQLNLTEDDMNIARQNIVQRKAQWPLLEALVAKCGDGEWNNITEPVARLFLVWFLFFERLAVNDKTPTNDDSCVLYSIALAMTLELEITQQGSCTNVQVIMFGPETSVGEGSRRISCLRNICAGSNSIQFSRLGDGSNSPVHSNQCSKGSFGLHKITSSVSSCSSLLPKIFVDGHACSLQDILGRPNDTNENVHETIACTKARSAMEEGKFDEVQQCFRGFNAKSGECDEEAALYLTGRQAQILRTLASDIFRLSAEPSTQPSHYQPVDVRTLALLLALVWFSSGTRDTEMRGAMLIKEALQAYQEDPTNPLELTWEMCEATLETEQSKMELCLIAEQKNEERCKSIQTLSHLINSFFENSLLDQRKQIERIYETLSRPGTLFHSKNKANDQSMANMMLILFCEGLVTSLNQSALFFFWLESHNLSSTEEVQQLNTWCTLNKTFFSCEQPMVYNKHKYHFTLEKKCSKCHTTHFPKGVVEVTSVADIDNDDNGPQIQEIVVAAMPDNLRNNLSAYATKEENASEENASDENVTLPNVNNALASFLRHNKRRKLGDN
jgi:hypothetical protein